MSLSIVHNWGRLLWPYKVPYNSVGMVALSKLMTASSPWPNCLAASLTSLMYASMSSLVGSKENVLHLSWRCFILSTLS